MECYTDIPTRTPNGRGRRMHVEYEKLRFSTTISLYLGNDTKDTVIVTMQYEKETVPKLLNGTIFNFKQELSYRKQIARQLRTQYVEGIYDNPATLKSRSRKLTRNKTIG